MLFPKITFHRPAPAVLVIFDALSTHLLKQVLGVLDAVVVPSVPVSINLHPALLCSALSHWRLLDWRFVIAQALRLRIGSVLGQFFHLYLLALAETVRPKVLFTTIDNSPAFHFLARYYRHGRCVAVQNGSRFPTDLEFLLPQPPHPASNLYFQDFFCFSDFEPEFFRARPSRYHAERFFPVGSPKASLFLASEPLAKPVVQYRICLISQWIGLPKDTALTGGIVAAARALDTLLAAYIEATGASIAIGLRSTSIDEARYFRECFGSACHLEPSRPQVHSTYRLMRRSDLAVCVNSTAGFEGFAWLQKMLFCNPSDSALQDLSVQGVWSLNRPQQTDFNRRIDTLLGMSDTAYRAAVEPSIARLMRYSKAQPAHVVLREHLEKLLN